MKIIWPKIETSIENNGRKISYSQNNKLDNPNEQFAFCYDYFTFMIKSLKLIGMDDEALSRIEFREDEEK